MQNCDYPDDSAAVLFVYGTGPIVFLDTVFIYFHIYMQHLWEITVKFTCRVSRRWRAGSEDQSLDSEHVFVSVNCQPSTKSSPIVLISIGDWYRRRLVASAGHESLFLATIRSPTTTCIIHFAFDRSCGFGFCRAILSGTGSEDPST